MLLISPGYYRCPNRNWRQCLCKMLGGGGGGGGGVGGSKAGVLWKMCKWRVLKILTEEWGFQNTNSQKNKLESLSIVICRTGGINQDTCKGCRNTSPNKRLKLRTIFIATLRVMSWWPCWWWRIKAFLSSGN